jgi:hypothetical protein
MDNNFYVYCHRRKSDNSVFYIGKGKDNRYLDLKNRNIHWKRIVSKEDGFIAEIIKNGLTEEESFIIETEEIKKAGLGNICNMTEGGSGGNTRKKYTEEEYEKWLTKKKHANLGKKREQWIVDKMSKSLKGVGTLDWYKNKFGEEEGIIRYENKISKMSSYHSSKKVSNDTKSKMSEAAKNRKMESVICDLCHKTVAKNVFKNHRDSAQCKKRQNK